MSIMPTKDNLTPKQETNREFDTHREYLGMSILGHTCARYLWYSFRWAFRQRLSPKQQRIFAQGDHEEALVLADLESWGYRILSQQQSYTDLDGHLQGHSDAVVSGFLEEDVLLEIKSINEKGFVELLKLGLQVSKPTYWSQVQLYLHYSGLKTAVVVCVNKNTQERKYLRVDYNEAEALGLVGRAIKIIESPVPLPRIGNANWFECRWCNAYEICHGGQPIEKSCRTCQFVGIENENWKCEKYNINLSIRDQQLGCDLYEKIAND